MATKSEVKCWLIDPMVALKSPPRGVENPEDGLVQYLEEFTNCSEQELKGAWLILRRSHTKQSWPTIGEIHAAVNEYRKRNGSNRGASGWFKHFPGTPEFEAWLEWHENEANRRPGTLRDLYEDKIGFILTKSEMPPFLKPSKFPEQERKSA